MVHKTMGPLRVNYISGGHNLLGNIRPLWEGLNQHHGSVSPHFKNDFSAHRFDQRAGKLLTNNEGGELYIAIALAGGQPVGYIIATAQVGGVGKIESIFIMEGFRGQGIGNELMCMALVWLDSKQVLTKLIDIVVGNEAAFKFYARFGFYPRMTTLQQKG